MPITWLTAWIGTLALVGFPFFAGFYSKDAIIEAVAESHRWGSGVAYFAVVAGVLITSIYSFRLLYLTFHGKERFEVVHDAGDHPPDGQLAHKPKESPLVVTIPLILLAIPSVVIGWMTIEPVLFGGWLNDSIFVLEQNRDAQLKALLVNETACAKEKLISVRHYDGMPISANVLIDAVRKHSQKSAAA